MDDLRLTTAVRCGVCEYPERFKQAGKPSCGTNRPAPGRGASARGGGRARRRGLHPCVCRQRDSVRFRKRAGCGELDGPWTRFTSAGEICGHEFHSVVLLYTAAILVASHHAACGYGALSEVTAVPVLRSTYCVSVAHTDIYTCKRFHRSKWHHNSCWAGEGGIVRTPLDISQLSFLSRLYNVETCSSLNMSYVSPFVHTFIRSFKVSLLCFDAISSHISCRTQLSTFSKGEVCTCTKTTVRVHTCSIL